MYLKRILLHGFKSFADRTEFDFGPGLTMVVGPNGCGKSNLLDALRWVLGTQSARALRGQKMSDVIFSGSRSRKPANAASVELTFDNRTHFLASDEAEVSVGRILYRNGDSEYRINGEPCRLKDVRHLFLDTGVGVDAYSIIEQGRVDMLLQANPVERREIFEEAAGISRYKVQRAEAQRKLERTHNNLLRLNDVVEELERRLRSVKLAAGKARRWQEYDARLREQRATFALAEYHELECARREGAARIASLTDELQEQRTELAAHDAEAAEHERNLQQCDDQIRDTEARLANLQSEHSALGERIAQCERRQAELAASRDRRQGQVAEFTERIRQIEERIGEEEAALELLVEAARRGAERVSELQTAGGEAVRRCDESRSALEHAKTAAFEAVRQAALLHSEQSNLATQLDRLAAQADRLAARQRELEQERTDLTRQRDEIAEQVAALDRQASELAEQIRQAEARLAELATLREEAEGELGVAKERRSALISQIELLEDMQRRLEGVDQGTQGVLAWRESADAPGGVIGLVADLLRIDDPRVWVLQPVLSTFENHVVVADTYAFLSELSRREELSGPVRVLALDRLPSDIPRVDYTGAPGFVARAVDWVNCQAKHRALAEHLLGRVIVVDVIERALAMAAGAPEGYVFVTLDGRAAAVSGQLTLGAAKASPGLISRQAEIRKLRGELDELETHLEQVTRRRNDLEQTLSDTQLQRRELHNRIASVQRDHAEARTVLTRAESELARAQREASAVDGELGVARHGLNEIRQQVEALGAQSEAAGQARQTHESQIATLQRELGEQEKVLAQLSHELTEAKVEAGRTLEKQAAGEESLDRLRASCAAQRRELDAAQHEVQEAAGSIVAAEEEAQTARSRLAECENQRQALQGEVLEGRERRQELRLRLENCGTRTREVNERIREREAKLHDCDVSQREIDVRQEGLVARIREDLSLDLVERYGTYEHAEQDWDAVRAEIEDLREKINRLGNVNLDALTELEELTPRHENLTAQRDDLLAAIQRLEALIDDLDRESRTRFAETFEQIRTNFQELFRKLFGGGKADIILEDPEQPLESGIEIVARPPGKEPQSISLLSGGEKTMTAVGLVMAVFKSKPSPFAFLDEVDAALDEANTERFNTLLQDFLSHSQFVVITHSKRTMQCADVLYGVTMEEPGVSKRVSVRFEDRVNAPSVA